MKKLVFTFRATLFHVVKLSLFLVTQNMSKTWRKFGLTIKKCDLVIWDVTKWNLIDLLLQLSLQCFWQWDYRWFCSLEDLKYLLNFPWLQLGAIFSFLFMKLPRGGFYFSLTFPFFCRLSWNLISSKFSWFLLNLLPLI